jgi:hypothetical protein
LAIAPHEGANGHLDRSEADRIVAGRRADGHRAGGGGGNVDRDSVRFGHAHSPTVTLSVSNETSRRAALTGAMGAQ